MPATTSWSSSPGTVYHQFPMLGTRLEPTGAPTPPQKHPKPYVTVAPRTIPDYPRTIPGLSRGLSPDYPADYPQAGQQAQTVPGLSPELSPVGPAHYPGLSPLHFLHISCCACKSNGMNCHRLPCPKTSGPNSSALSRTIPARFFTAILRRSK